MKQSEREMQRRFSLTHRVYSSGRFMFGADLKHDHDFNFKLNDEVIGRGRVAVVPKFREVSWTLFYPHGRTKTREVPESKVKKGIGTLAYVTALLKLHAANPHIENFKLVAISPSVEFKKMLIAMGVDKNMQFSAHLRTVIEYANRKGFDFQVPKFKEESSAAARPAVGASRWRDFLAKLAFWKK